MHVRLAQLSDVAQITRLGRQLIELHTDFDKDYYALENNFDELFSNWVKQQINIPQRFIFVAEEKESIVGFISGFMKPLYHWFQTKTVGHISYMIIGQNFRRRGIGRLLEEASVTWFKSQNISYVELYTHLTQVCNF